VSESGDPVGQGLSDTYSLPDPSAVVTWVGHGLSIGNFGRWTGRFEMPTSVARAEVGYYAGLRGTPTYNPTRGSVQWGVDGRSCEVESGWLAIDGITYDVTNAIAALDLRFEQRCKGSTGALHGLVHVGR
jgi:hypothetical protein